MATGVGEAAAGAVSERRRPWAGWGERLVVALGGAVVAVVAVLLVSSWQTGLRASSFEQLQADLADGTVQQWYAAEQLESGPLDLTRAPASGVRGDLEEGAEGAYLPPKGEPLGGILVWRTWGGTGWLVASPAGTAALADDLRMAATEESTALVGQLREAQVPMKPFEFSDGSWVAVVVTFGGLGLFAFLVMGPSPRVGTRWFWLWVMLTLPAASGVLAYAVLELVGIRRRPDRPLDRRISGLRGFLGSILVSMVLLAVAHTLRDNGVPLPL
ncbi:hypothetical protein ACOCJ5_10250 [Knoellia sp. CPCC 206450]|uniref:hypothetical protein n=1 Tax=Knoellia tibetensis TaxID=3404798 RepID=UPI003B438184